MKKHILKIILFSALTCALLVPLYRILGCYDDTGSAAMFRQLYGLPRDTVDAVFIGASSIQEFFIPSVIYEETGVTTFDVSMGNMSFNTYQHLIKECERIQDPDIYFVGIRTLAKPHFENVNIRRVVDNMQWSANKLDLIQYAYTNLEADHPGACDDYWTFFFPLAAYHSRWVDLKESDFSDKVDCFFGALFNTRVRVWDKAEIQARVDAEPQPAPEEGLKYLNDLLAYCDTLEKPVVFVETPSCVAEDVFAKYNYVEQIIEERGYPVWDMNAEVDAMGIDYATDWGDTMHLNDVGMVKFSKYIAHVLADQYSLPDHRGGVRYRAWQKMADYYNERFLEQQLSHEKDFSRYLEYLQQVDINKYSVYIAIKDIQGFHLTQEMTDALKAMGFDQADTLLDHTAYHSFVGVLGDGSVLWQQVGQDDEPSQFVGTVEGKSVQVDSQVLKGGNKACILINGNNYAVNKRGFNIVVYDNKDNELIDAVAFDTHAPDIPLAR